MPELAEYIDEIAVRLRRPVLMLRFGHSDDPMGTGIAQSGLKLWNDSNELGSPSSRALHPRHLVG